MLEDFLKRYRYKADTIDSWRVLDSSTGVLEGDCDDFALTVAWIISEKSWFRFWWNILTFQLVFWFTKTSRGEAHIMLWSIRYGWIDCNHPSWGDRHYKKWFPWLLPMVAMKLFISWAIKKINP